MLYRKGGLYDGRFGRRLGLATLAVIVCALALASSALRWGVPLPHMGDTGEPKDERPDVGQDHTPDRADPNDEALPQGHVGQETLSAPAESPASAAKSETRETSHVTTYETSSSLESTADELLGRYRDLQCCLMRHAGYVDLLGNVWSCVVEGPGWVDVCLVSALDDCASCQVRVSRLEVGEWEEHAVV